MGASLWKGPDLGRLAAEQLRRTGLKRALERLDPDSRSRFSAMDQVEDIYRRFGFEVAAEGRLAGGGPAFWVMRRSPARGRPALPVREQGG